MPYYVKKPVVIQATKFAERDFVYWRTAVSQMDLSFIRLRAK